MSRQYILAYQRIPDLTSFASKMRKKDGVEQQYRLSRQAEVCGWSILSPSQSPAKEALCEHGDKNTFNEKTCYCLEDRDPDLRSIRCEQFIEDAPMKCSNVFK